MVLAAFVVVMPATALVMTAAFAVVVPMAAVMLAAFAVMVPMAAVVALRTQLGFQLGNLTEERTVALPLLGGQFFLPLPCGHVVREGHHFFPAGGVAG